MNGLQRDTGRMTGAIILILLGAAFLFAQIFDINLWSFAGRWFSFEWPFYIILPGAAMVAVAVLGGRSVAALAVPGVVVGGTGLILLYQEWTGRFETWAYMWALYPVFVGLALMYVGMRTGNPGMSQGGRRAAVIGMVLLLIFGSFMEIIFSGNFDLVFRYGLPIILIGGGAALLFSNRRSQVRDEKAKNGVSFAPPLDRKPKNGYGINPSLERQITDALIEDDPSEPRSV